MAALGISPESVAPGEAVVVCTADDSHYNPIGIVHGGLVCTMLSARRSAALGTPRWRPAWATPASS
jgi:acyl-coenzyme A thioesterase PaaI-like protein